MGAIVIKQEELQRLTEQYLNNPLRNSLIRQKAAILEITIPTYIVSRETKEIITKYDVNTAELLSKIDSQLKDIENDYRLKLEE